MKKLYEKLNTAIEERKAMLKEQEEQIYMDYGVKIVNFAERMKEKYCGIAKILGVRLVARLVKIDRNDECIRLVVNETGVELIYDSSMTADYNIIPHCHKVDYLKDYARFLNNFENWEHQFEQKLLDDITKEQTAKIEELDRQERYLDKLRKGLE